MESRIHHIVDFVANAVYDSCAKSYHWKEPQFTSGKIKHGLKKSHILACNNINFYPYDTACGDGDD